MADLQSYKAWAEAKIALLIQRMREGERQRREEATRVAAEATSLKKVREKCAMRTHTHWGPTQESKLTRAAGLTEPSDSVVIVRFVHAALSHCSFNVQVCTLESATLLLPAGCKASFLCRYMASSYLFPSDSVAMWQRIGILPQPCTSRQMNHIHQLHMSSPTPLC